MVLSSPKYSKSQEESRFIWGSLTGLEPVRMSLEQGEYFDKVFQGRFPTRYEYSVMIDNIKSNKVSDYMMEAYEKLKKEHPNDYQSIREMGKVLNDYRRNNGLKEIKVPHSFIVCLP